MSHKLMTNNGVASEPCRCHGGTPEELSFNHETGVMKGHRSSNSSKCCPEDPVEANKYRELCAATQKVKEEVEAIKQSLAAKLLELNGIASESSVQSAITAINNIDFSALAKQGANTAATNTAILAAFNTIDFSSLATLSLQQQVHMVIREVFTAIIEKTHTEYGYHNNEDLPNRIRCEEQYYDLVGVESIDGTSYSKWACTLYSDHIEYVYTNAAADGAVGTTVYQMGTEGLESIGVIAEAKTVILAQKDDIDTAKEAIIAAMPSVPTVQQIQNGLATESNATSNKEAIIAAMSEISVDTSNLATKAVEQFFGIEGAYEAEAKGGERTNNTVIDECKVRFQDAFNGLLPTGFTMPNSVTVDNLTYTGTTNS